MPTKKHSKRSLIKITTDFMKPTLRTSSIALNASSVKVNITMKTLHIRLTSISWIC